MVATRGGALTGADAAGPDADFKRGVLGYKYVSPSCSVLERLYLNSFWDKCAASYPDWLAPNIITLTGGSCILLAFSLAFGYSPGGCGEAPSWVYGVAAVLYFAYQTLDGSDGKQARRTKSGSSLGELMDHGVDAVTTGLIAAMMGDCFALGTRSPIFWAFLLSGQIAFLLSNLTLVHRGKQTFYDVDVMEVQTAMIVSLLITGFAGVRWWRDDALVPIPSFFPFSMLAESKMDFGGRLGSYPGEWNDDTLDFTSGYAPLSLVFMGCGMMGVTKNIISCSVDVLRSYALPEGSRPSPIESGNPGCTLAGFAHQCACLAMHVAGSWAAFQGMREKAMPQDAYLALIICTCFAFGDLMDRVLIMRVAKVPLTLVPPVALITPGFAAMVRHGESVALLDGLGVDWWWLLAGAAILVHVSYFVAVSRKIADVLQIHPFRIGKWKKK